MMIMMLRDDLMVMMAMMMTDAHPAERAKGHPSSLCSLGSGAISHKSLRVECLVVRTKSLVGEHEEVGHVDAGSGGNALSVDDDLVVVVHTLIHRHGGEKALRLTNKAVLWRMCLCCVCLCCVCLCMRCAA